MNHKDLKKISFSKSAVYQIKVKGKIEQRFSGYFGGMQIKFIKESEDEIYSVLTGSVTDQAALSGILNSLYEMHFTILSVKQLTDTDIN